MVGVGVRAGGRERELDARGLRYLRDGKGASAQKRTRQRHSRGAAEAAPLLSGQTSSAWAAEGARREGLSWTASASELWAQSGSWTLEVYVICATVTG